MSRQPRICNNCGRIDDSHKNAMEGRIWRIHLTKRPSVDLCSFCLTGFFLSLAISMTDSEKQRFLAMIDRTSFVFFN